MVAVGVSKEIKEKYKAEVEAITEFIKERHKESPISSVNLVLAQIMVNLLPDIMIELCLCGKGKMEDPEKAIDLYYDAIKEAIFNVLSQYKEAIEKTKSDGMIDIFRLLKKKEHLTESEMEETMKRVAGMIGKKNG